MSEQHPLLYEDYCEEEQVGSYIHRRIKPMTLKSRARYHVKGAAAIITKWPDQLTSLVIYWWVGIGMIALTVFIIYNSLFSLAAVLPSKYNSIAKPFNHANTKHDNISSMKSQTDQTNVYLHIFVDEDVNVFHRWLPNIDKVSSAFKKFQFNIVVVKNDTAYDTIDNSKFSDEKQNEMALNMLWSENKFEKRPLGNTNNTFLTYTSISDCLNDSPMKKYWRKIPNHIVKYLIRGASIWQDGGIAIDPILFQPEYQKKDFAIYKEYQKTLQLLGNFEKKNISDNELAKLTNIKENIIPKVNNVLDIINALENNEISDNSKEEILTAAESIDYPEYTINKLITHLNVEDESTSTNTDQISFTKSKDLKHLKHTDEKRDPDLLPLFINYLFHQNLTKNLDKTSSTPKVTYTTIKDEAEDDKLDIEIISAWKHMKKGEYPGILSSILFSKQSHKDLTLDLKGYIIATQIPCHALLGSMFTNSIYNNESETLTDFIIKELTLFCKGVLATCAGSIDIIFAEINDD